MESPQTHNLQEFQLFLIPRSSYLLLLFFTFSFFCIRSMILNTSFHQASKPSGLFLLQKASQKLLLVPLRVTVQRCSPKESAQSVTARSPISFFWTLELGPLFSFSLQGSRSTEIFLRVRREDRIGCYSSFCNNKSKINHHHLFFLIWYHDQFYRQRTTNNFIWALFL